jgi:hypothetical protein
MSVPFVSRPLAQAASETGEHRRATRRTDAQQRRNTRRDQEAAWIACHRRNEIRSRRIPQEIAQRSRFDRSQDVHIGLVRANDQCARRCTYMQRRCASLLRLRQLRTPGGRSELDHRSGAASRVRRRNTDTTRSQAFPTARTPEPIADAAAFRCRHAPIQRGKNRSSIASPYPYRAPLSPFGAAP